MTALPQLVPGPRVDPTSAAPGAQVCAYDTCLAWGPRSQLSHGPTGSTDTLASNSLLGCFQTQLGLSGTHRVWVGGRVERCLSLHVPVCPLPPVLYFLLQYPYRSDISLCLYKAAPCHKRLGLMRGRLGARVQCNLVPAPPSWRVCTRACITNTGTFMRELLGCPPSEAYTHASGKWAQICLHMRACARRDTRACIHRPFFHSLRGASCWHFLSGPGLQG